MARQDASRFARFCGFGAIGFLVDAGILTLLVNGFGWHHYPGRMLSFALAVTVTWLLNRNWVFRRTANPRAEYARYFSIQGVGAVINLGTYVTVIEVIPSLAAIPVIPLAVGAVIALVFNFLASRRFVFRETAGNPVANQTGAMSSSYSGRENLEAMRHAKNYNAYLESLVLKHATTGETLDFGAGAGTFAVPLANAGLDVSCVEPDATLRQQLTEAGLKAHSSLDEVPQDSVDYVYSLNVLEHIEDDDAMLAELAERLRRGGRLLLYVPAFQILYSSMDANVGHFRRYRLKPLRQLVEQAGLRVEHARYVDSIGFGASLLFKWFGNDAGSLSPGSIRLYDRIAFPLSRLCDLLLGRLFGKNLLLVAARSGQN